MILRYDRNEFVRTRCNPLEDLCSWVSGLRSSGHTSEILKEKHGFSRLKDIREAAEAISAHAEHAVNFINQAFSGPPDLSYLPIYYALLNLSKIYIICSGRLPLLLQSQRWHGASYEPMAKQSQDLMTERIIIKRQGVIPLFYHTLTGQPVHAKNIFIRMKEIYPLIRNVSYEYCTIYKEAYQFAQIDVDVEGNQNAGFNLKAVVTDLAINGNRAFQKTQLKALVSFSHDPKTKNIFRSGKIKCTESDAKKKLVKFLRRYLLCTDFELGRPYAVTLLSAKRFLFPEEIPLLLAFFHLSNIVRYNPRFLEKLKDSRAWSLLLALPKQGSLCFLELFWSYVHQANYKIVT